MDRFTWGIVVGALVLVIAGLGTVVLTQRQAPPPDLSQPEGIVRAYVEALDSGHPEQAWDLLAASARSGSTRDSFIARATASSSGRQREGRLTIESVVVEGSVSRVELARTFDSGGGLFGASGQYTNRSTVRLEREAGQWRITVPPEPYLIDRPVAPVAPPPVTVQVTVVATIATPSAPAAALTPATTAARAP